MRLGFDFLCDYFRVMDMISSSTTKWELNNASVYLAILENTKSKYDPIDHSYFENQIKQLHYELDFINVLLTQGVRLQKIDEPLKYFYHV